MLNRNQGFINKESISKLINERINNFYNNKIVFIFKENTRQMLQIEFDWKHSQIP